MKPIALSAPQREQRKQDLLLASQLARLQLRVSLDELGGRVDGAAERVAQVRRLAMSPAGLIAGGLIAVFLARLSLRRGRPIRLMRWGWLAWRVWRSAAAASGAAPLHTKA